MSDIFEETEETLRTEQWMKIVRTALPWVIGVLVAALIAATGVFGWQSWKKHVAQQASDYYSQGFDALGKGDTVQAKTRFGQASKAGNEAYRSMALQQLGALAAEDGKTTEALKDYDEAAKVSDPILSDTAALKAAYVAMDTASYADMEKRLTPLTKEGRPAQYLAKEALAMAKLQAGDAKGARAILASISITLGAPEGLRQRAAGAMAAIDSGAGDTARQIAKQPEAAMPLPSPIISPPGGPAQ